LSSEQHSVEPRPSWLNSQEKASELQSIFKLHFKLLLWWNKPPQTFYFCFKTNFGFKIFVVRWGTNNLHFCFCFSDSLDWIGYDEKLEGKTRSITLKPAFPSASLKILGF
jgi:hypothetical protein